MTSRLPFLALALLGVLANSSRVFADSQLSMENPSLPGWLVVPLDGDELACYDLEGAKALRVFEAECSAARDMLFIREHESKLLRGLIEETSSQLRANLVTLRGLKGRLELNTKLLKESDQRLYDAERTSVFGGALPWVVTAVVTASVTGYLWGASNR